MARTASSKTLPVCCFAPPLTDELLAEYRAMAEVCPYGAEAGDALKDLVKCVEAWWELPESTRQDVTRWKLYHVPRKEEIEVVETPLEQEHIDALYEVTPWLSELDRLSKPDDTGLFDHMAGDERTMAFHLLWYVKELALDREPMSQDKLPK